MNKDVMRRRWFSGLICLGFIASQALSALPAQAEEKLWIDGSSTEHPIDLKLPSLAPVIEAVGKAVVNISIEGTEKVGNPFTRKGKGGGGEGFGDPNGSPQSPFDFFFQFPPDAQQGKRKFSSLGSGFVINPDGYIVTNQHVVDKATKILISFRDDKRTYEAKVIGSDPKTDLALIKVDMKEKLTPVPLGDSDAISPGDWVIAIGNPFRLGHTATLGIVSAKSRRVPQEGRPYDSFIQTDASINPGNSGGPLINSKGEVVGINTAIFSPGKIGASGFNIGIGFATPINLVKSIIPQLKLKGKVTRGWLGVLIQPVSEDVASALKLSSASGALVAQVLEKSPAQKAGFQHGDVIISFNGNKIEENDQLPLMVAQTELGKTVDVEILRGGKPKTLKVKIEELKDEETPEVEEPEEAEETTAVGLSVQDLTPEMAKGLGVDIEKGVVITGVLPETPAADAGLKRGDIILEADSKEMTSAKDFRKLTKTLEKNKPVLLLVMRGSSTLFLTLKVE